MVPVVATSVGDPQAMLASLIEPRAALQGIPLVLVAMGGLETTPGTHPGTTVLGSVSAAVAALARVTKYAEWLRQPRDPAAPTDEERAAAARQQARELGSGGWLAAA